jgi:hypothetical protein
MHRDPEMKNPQGGAAYDARSLLQRAAIQPPGASLEPTFGVSGRVSSGGFGNFIGGVLSGLTGSSLEGMGFCVTELSEQETSVTL